MTPGSRIHTPMKALALATMTAFAAGLSAQTVTTTNELKIYTAIEVEFATETNKVYRLEGAADVTSGNWTTIGPAVYGSGKTVSQVFSARAGETVNYDFYRLAISESTNSGFAPWAFTGVSLQLSDDNFTERLNFTSATAGAKVRALNNDPFTYTFAKTAQNSARAELRFNNGKHHIYVFTFTTETLGSHVREEFVNGILDDRDFGTFSVAAGIQEPGGGGGTMTNVPTARPEALTGTAFVFNSGATPERLEFRTATTGIEFEHILLAGEIDDPDGFSYTYSLVGTNGATIVADFGDGKRDEYVLTFTSGASGSFVRREFRKGVLDDTDTGTFSPAAVATDPNNGGGNPGGGTGGDTGGTPAAPSAVTGLRIIMNDGTPDTMHFATATSGTETDADSFDSFTYVYTVTGPTTATLRLNFGFDEWDEYDLTYTGAGSGTFIQREYEDGVLDKTESGTFTTQQ